MKQIKITIDKKTGGIAIESNGEGACLAARKLGAGLGIKEDEWEDQFNSELTAEQSNEQEAGL